jgi:hypothetical protein
MDKITEQRQAFIEAGNLELKRYGQIERLENQIERLRKKIAKHRAFWGDYLVKPIAEELLPLLPDYDRFERFGPFGLTCEYSIHFYRIGSQNPYKCDKDIKSLTFVPGNFDEGEIYLRDFSVYSGQFNKGTLGEINGMNYGCLPIPKENTVQWLLEQINKQETKNA